VLQAIMLMTLLAPAAAAAAAAAASDVMAPPINRYSAVRLEC